VLCYQGIRGHNWARSSTKAQRQFAFDFVRMSYLHEQLCFHKVEPDGLAMCEQRDSRGKKTSIWYERVTLVVSQRSKTSRILLFAKPEIHSTRQPYTRASAETDTDMRCRRGLPGSPPSGGDPLRGGHCRPVRRPSPWGPAHDSVSRQQRARLTHRQGGVAEGGWRGSRDRPRRAGPNAGIPNGNLP